MANEIIKDIGIEAAKLSPPAAVVGTSLANDWTINHTVAALTIVYLLLQIGWLLWRWHRAANGRAVGAD
ncbi:hypothetical protein [Acidovorax sp. SUPP2825]|uniref:hypothetical protein n=1 Tax=Acidovorax sp. SUPP2825 TaxID=2920879 RepID=UPI0023DE463B|nr:hypothetical protein [Acidovorax sp. SUPP2825]GKS93242.1 hypothetical protein AVAK2825_01925 [Acidovorax sp. SUPP2825]